MLRHPVVLTSLEEDFKAIGLIREDKAEATRYNEGLPTSQGGEVGSGQQGHAPNSADDGSRFAAKGSTSSSRESQRGHAGLPGIPYTVGGDNLNSQSPSRKDANLDYAEAVEYMEDFQAFWEANDHRETIELDDEQMEELESMGECFTLDTAILAEGDDDDDDDDEDEFEEEESASGYLNSLHEHLAALQAHDVLESREAALPGFANIALIAETLSDTFKEAGAVLEDADYTEMARGYAEMAEYAAQVVGFLESEEDVDFEAVNGTFSEFTETLMTGVRAFAALTESDDSDDDDDDDEGDDDEGDDEADEGKMPPQFMAKFKKKGKKGKMQAGEN